ncbi:hypothetical protein SAMN05216275_104171 [Streptosporangium canum]|uniref:Uncharacterized protein n=1 Tax=Streptosporangium canum TaxID=324952 RepID=A0A1I3JXN6_9ACTN|nr:hypothetical protein [Streptosporangium canum]SFI65029.1 hypothetical protein SAMN05216275_104171 [Streptosporangium canum]
MKNSTASPANLNVAAKISAAIVSTAIGFTALIGGQAVSTVAGTTWDSASSVVAGTTWDSTDGTTWDSASLLAEGTTWDSASTDGTTWDSTDGTTWDSAAATTSL